MGSDHRPLLRRDPTPEAVAATLPEAEERAAKAMADIDAAGGLNTVPTVSVDDINKHVVGGGKIEDLIRTCRRTSS